MGDDRGARMEARIRRLREEARKLRSRGLEDEAEEVEEEISLLTMLPEDHPLVSEFVEAVLDLEANLKEHEANARRKL